MNKKPYILYPNEYVNFCFWIFKCLDIQFIDGDFNSLDISEIIEQSNPDSFEDLAKKIIKFGFLYDPNNYEKDIDLWNDIIKYMIISFKKNDIKIFDDKCKLIEFLYENRN